MVFDTGTDRLKLSAGAGIDPLPTCPGLPRLHTGMSAPLGALTHVDGIPAYVGTKDGPLTAGLVVRVGECDEQLAHHGISHLVEHLTLSAVGRNLTTWNGFVDLQTTNFVVQGSPAEVVGFFDTVCRTICNPPYDRIPTEAQVLRTEAASRGGRGVVESSMSARIGPRNYGLRDYREFCFDQPDPRLVHHWITRHYTTGNAAFWCTGPLPPDLRLPLPAGPAVAPPAPTWIDEAYPAFVHDRPDQVALTIVDGWTTEALVAAGVLREHFYDVLRTRHGLSYDVGATTESLCGGQLLHSAWWADGLAENLEAVRDHMAAEVQRLSWDGPPPETLARVLDGMRRAAEEDSDDAPVASQARCHVLGTPFVPLDEMLAVAEVMTPADVAATVARAMRSALWLVPAEISWYDRRATGTRPWSVDRVHGPATPIAVPVDEDDRRQLVVAAEGASMCFGQDDQRITVRFDQAAALLAYPDGDRTLIGDDGFVIRIEATRWPDPAGLVGFIDSRVPPARIVYMPTKP